MVGFAFAALGDFAGLGGPSLGWAGHRWAWLAGQLHNGLRPGK